MRRPDEEANAGGKRWATVRSRSRCPSTAREGPRRAFRSILLGLLLVLSFSALPRQHASADDVEQRIAEFWQRVDALGPSDVLTAADLGQWALSLTQRDPGAGITVADFRASTAAMQEAFDRAGVGVPPGTPRGADVEGRIARFWQTLDALGPGDVVTAADLGQWALNVTDRDPNKRIRVDDFRASTGGMQGGLERARSLPRPAAPVIATPTPTPRPTPSPTPTATPQRTIALGQTVTGSIAPNGQDRWRFAGSAGQRVRIEMSGFDTVLRLLDAGDRTVATNDDRASNDYGSLIEVTLPSTGTYTIVAAGYQANSGSYRLSLSSVASATPTPTPTPTAAPTAARPTPAPPSPTPTGITLTDAQDATVPCGTGASNVDATVTGIRSGLNGLIIGDTATIAATAPSGTYLRWVFGGRGTLTISGCTAWYSVASIGTAYQTSATIRIMRAAAPTPTPAPTPPPTPTPSPCTGSGLQCGSTTVPGRAGPTPGPTIPAGEGGPRVVFVDKTITINVYDPANQPGGTRCGNEYLQVSLSGPYSYSVNQFWVNGPGTDFLWAGPFFNNAHTFQPIATGTYQINVAWDDGQNANYVATVTRCGSARVIKSKQGWGVPVN